MNQLQPHYSATSLYHTWEQKNARQYTKQGAQNTLPRSMLLKLYKELRNVIIFTISSWCQ